MSEPIIQVENLGKKYIIGHQQENHGALRYAISAKAKNFSRQILRSFRKKVSVPNLEEFWALKDVSFEINRGDRLGIIGRNGAGKSTLLKILSRITEPTTGRVSIKGRVASLLEVGTGFHGDLTGRENIYLNGAILGMSRAEIKRKFDEIVAFAEIEKFLDTPVKRYSSGMYVRLAFAVAAHLEPEILIVDEVLAVGDAQFQKKCLGKMEEVGKDGRTVLFVSHNMGVVESLCNQGIYLKDGQIIFTGSIQKTIHAYQTRFKSFINNPIGILYRNEDYQQDYFNDQSFQILEIKLVDENGTIQPCIQTWDTARLRISYYSPRKITKGSVILEICTVSGTKLIQYSTQPLAKLDLQFKPGKNCIDCIIPKLPLASGEYQLNLGLAVPMVEWLCWQENLAQLEVGEKDVFQSSYPPYQQLTPIVVEHYWEVQ